MRAFLIVILLVVIRPPALQTFSPDAEGFIRNWLVLAPIAIDGESGAAEIDSEMLAGEATITPKGGDKAVGPGGKVLSWTAHQNDDYFIDFLSAFGKERGEYVAGYAVAYITASTEMTVTLALSSNDQGKAWFNGKPVFRFAETRTLEKDSDHANVTLVKGQNVLVLKVINEVNNWQGCARFLKDGKPVTDISISVAPSGK
jgi:hypothetical protein